MHAVIHVHIQSGSDLCTGELDRLAEAAEAAVRAQEPLVNAQGTVGHVIPGPRDPGFPAAVR